ncbi:hypothetical protein N826_08665 [Skermanella aerolata KACC 11604]|nr:hypothetical protein N826_08665 [Skermanella aerolata KACC 11604]
MFLTVFPVFTGARSEKQIMDSTTMLFRLDTLRKKEVM